MSGLFLNREQVREVDRRAIAELGMSGLVLMENAGRGAVDVLERLGVAGPVAICCGAGNNGGDGFVMARHLDLRGHEVRVLLFVPSEKLTGDAAENHAILRRAGVPVDVLASDDTDRAARLVAGHLAGADWIVDALLGTGARGAPRPPLDAVIDALNAAPARRLAVDLPSGLDCDTGSAAEPTFRADHTCTFVAAKSGFAAPGAEAFTGAVHVCDIGVPRAWLERVAGAA